VCSKSPCDRTATSNKFESKMEVRKAPWISLPCVVVLCLLQVGDCRKEDVIQDITAKQLDALMEESDYVAVYWCKYDLALHFGEESAFKGLKI